MRERTWIIVLCLGIVGIPAQSMAHPSNIPHKHLEELNGPKPKKSAPPRHLGAPPRRKTVKKRSRTRHNEIGLSFSFGPTLNYTSPDPGDIPHTIFEMGGGADFSLGVRINPYTGFRMNAMFSLHGGKGDPSMNGAFLSGITGDALLYILPEAKVFEPYGLVGIGGFGLTGGGLDLPLQGIGAQAGLGFRLRLSPAASIALEGLIRLTYMDNSQERLHFEPFASALLFLQSVGLRVVLDL